MMYYSTFFLVASLALLTQGGADEQENGAVSGDDINEPDIASSSNVELLSVASTLAASITTLSNRLQALEEHNKELSGNLNKLQIAAKDLLYDRFLELSAEDYEESYAADIMDGSDESIVTTALWYLREAAEAGHLMGQLELGIMYDTGYPGLNQSHILALAWYLRAAMSGLPEAQCYVGMAYHMGRGVNQSDETAIKWYRIAAENENGIAQNNLGWMLLTGGKSEKIVTPEEEAEAVKWFERSAEQGEPFGKANLGLCYTIGAGGLDVDHYTALQLYRDMEKKDIERYGTVSLNESPIWRSNMMQWFTIAADAGEKLAILILEIHNITDSSGEIYTKAKDQRSSNSEQAF